jgi:hypothetical protein
MRTNDYKEARGRLRTAYLAKLDRIAQLYPLGTILRGTSEVDPYYTVVGKVTGFTHNQAYALLILIDGASFYSSELSDATEQEYIDYLNR